jgi:tetratricopeptide (TPR) repeat protein
MSQGSLAKQIHGVLLGLALAVSVLGQDKVTELERRVQSNPKDESALMELGRLYHDQGTSGDDNAVEKSFECFDKALAIDSMNAVALAYRGSLWTMRARDSWWPPSKLNHLRRGGAELDRAVEIAPDNIMVRLLRGINGLGLPAFAGRLPTSLEDFIILLRHPALPEQTRELKVAIYYYAGVAHKRADEYDRARELFKRAISIMPDSEFARRSQEELRDM